MNRPLHYRFHGWTSWWDRVRALFRREHFQLIDLAEVLMTKTHWSTMDPEEIPLIIEAFGGLWRIRRGGNSFVVEPLDEASPEADHIRGTIGALR